MEFRTIVDIPKPDFEIQPCEELLFVGSCFADSISQRFREEGFPVTSNPYGVMYNPVSILHTVQRYEGAPARSDPSDSFRRNCSPLRPVLTICNRPSTCSASATPRCMW